MSSTNREVKFEQSIPAKPEDVFYAVSTSQGWRDWLVDAAYFRAQLGGSFHLSWDTGWYASGTVEALDKPEKVTLEWRGKDAPAATRVAISLEPSGENTLFRVVQSGFGEGEAWEASREMAKSGWEVGLENLESIFDKGADLRITRRPMVGIFGNDFNAEIAADLGVPVTEGMRLAGTAEGMGAEKAGLQGDDVIIEMAGTSVGSWEELGPILQRSKAGDIISVSFYRGPEKHEVEMELSGRRIPDTPLDPAAFAGEYRKVGAEVVSALRKALEGASEDDAEITIGDAWSIKENIAHLVVGEEWYLFYLTELLVDGESQYAGTWENRREQLRAVVATTPALEQLVERLENAYEQTCRLLEESAQVLGARKGVMWRLGTWRLQFPGEHEKEHIKQIKKDLEKIRAVKSDPAAP
jgi:uncharacterized protein YndB with AHSA1/START domain